jgi:hypothetical protein
MITLKEQMETLKYFVEIVDEINEKTKLNINVHYNGILKFITIFASGNIFIMDANDEMYFNRTFKKANKYLSNINKEIF